MAATAQQRNMHSDMVDDVVWIIYISWEMNEEKYVIAIGAVSYFDLVLVTHCLKGVWNNLKKRGIQGTVAVEAVAAIS